MTCTSQSEASGAGRSAGGTGPVALKTMLWLATVLAATVVGLLGGYAVSSYTGVEPGYFETPEAGGYGGGSGATEGAAMDEEYERYYKSLTEQ